MTATRPSMEDVNSLLFADEAEELVNKNQDSLQPQSEPRLLKEKGLSAELDDLQPVPYYKRPSFQAGAMLAVAVPLGWMLVSAFSGGGTPTAQNPQTTQQDQENQLLRESLERERQKNQDLAIESGLRTQELEVIPVKPKPTPTPPVRTTPAPPVARPVAVRPQPQYAAPPPRRVATPTLTQSAPRPVSYPVQAPARPAPAAKPAQPEPDPMEQWLAQANQGHYLAAKGDSGYAAQPAAYTPSASPEIYAATPAQLEQSSSMPGADVPTVIPLGQEANAGYPQGPSDGSFPLQPGSTVASDPMAEQVSPFEGYDYAYNPDSYLDIGSTATAVLQSGVAWTQRGSQPNRNYILRLSEGFKNSSGKQILPKGTRLIAQVSETSDAGLFSMEITHILQGREKTPVPAGALQVTAKDGSPLQADLKRKGGRSFWADFGSILAPGVEQAMDAVAGSADRLVLQEGDSSIIRTSGGSDSPLASGLSGIATGASRVFSTRLEDAPEDRALPYFELGAGKTVRIFVNEDLAL